MNKKAKIAAFLLRLAFGWLFLYAGITKLLNPAWSAAGYLMGAQTFPGLYAWFAAPENLVWVNALNVWGQIFIGVALLLGVATCLAAWSGILLMVLYYLPVLNFPYIGTHAFLVDEHIIYILGLALLIAVRAGRYWGIDGMLRDGIRRNKWFGWMFQ